MKITKIKFEVWVVFIALFLAAVLWHFSGKDSPLINFWGNYLDPWMGVLTFSLAVIIAFRFWDNKLPKKLTVHFVHQTLRDDKSIDKYIFTCHRAYLSSEGDIRQWAQQIGNQMNGGHLSFYPYISQSASRIEYHIKRENLTKVKKGNWLRWFLSSKEFFKLYEVTFYLEKAPKNYYTIWWDNDPATPQNKILYIKGDVPFEIDEENAERLINSIENNKGNKSEIIIISLKNGVEQTIYKKELSTNEPVPERALIFVNFSNHNSAKWSEEQKVAAVGFLKDNRLEIIDIQFPEIDPVYSIDEIACHVDVYFKQIKNINPACVHIMGEQTFCFELISKLKEGGFTCVASTTKREVEEKEGKKISNFQFVGFRSY